MLALALELLIYFVSLFQARYNKADKVPEVYDLYAMAHTGSYKKVKAFSASDLDDPKNFTNISSHDKLMQYKIGRAHV